MWINTHNKLGHQPKTIQKVQQDNTINHKKYKIYIIMLQWYMILFSTPLRKIQLKWTFDVCNVAYMKNIKHARMVSSPVSESVCMKCWISYNDLSGIFLWNLVTAVLLWVEFCEKSAIRRASSNHLVYTLWQEKSKYTRSSSSSVNSVI